jgi:hypothetical protein
MTKADRWKIRPADLRRIASQTREPERERKMLALAEQLEEREAATAYSAGKHENGTPR